MTTNRATNDELIGQLYEVRRELQRRGVSLVNLPAEFPTPQVETSAPAVADSPAAAAVRATDRQTGTVLAEVWDAIRAMNHRVLALEDARDNPPMPGDDPLPCYETVPYGAQRGASCDYLAGHGGLHRHWRFGEGGSEWSTISKIRTIAQ